jgi:hypothetical protein
MTISTKIASVLLLACMIMPVSFGQEKLNKEKIRDAFTELDGGTLTLRFFNALNGNAIADASVDIEGLGSFRSDDDGRVLFQASDMDTTYSVHVEAEGYITSDFTIEIMAGTLFFNRFSISPLMELKYLRVVLDWDAEPRDLDAHFVKAGEYHLSYRNLCTTADGQGLLDRDDMDGFGPETITLMEVSSTGAYEYYVHDYSNRDKSSPTQLSRSKASIKVYGEGRLLYVFGVPADQPGTVWSVFRIERGQIIPTGELRERIGE